jgi:hypothetical protein
VNTCLLLNKIIRAIDTCFLKNTFLRNAEIELGDESWVIRELPIGCLKIDDCRLKRDILFSLLLRSPTIHLTAD